MAARNEPMTFAAGGDAAPVLHGVDFSGADAGGAAKIRVASRDLAAPRAAIQLGGRLDRRGLLRAVLASRDDGRRHVWRVDAPMGLPVEVVDAFGLQHDWLEVARWMHAFGSPRQWRSAVRERTRREPRRECDRAFGTPMAPMNLRVFKQTWTFVCELLLPLADEGVRIEPVLDGRDGRVAIGEGCPASILAAKGWPKRGYKGAGAPPAAVRADIVRRLRDDGLNIASAAADEAIADAEGDLLDALILCSTPEPRPIPPVAAVEGWLI